MISDPSNDFFFGRVDQPGEKRCEVSFQMSPDYTGSPFYPQEQNFVGGVCVYIYICICGFIYVYMGFINIYMCLYGIYMG